MASQRYHQIFLIVNRRTSLIWSLTLALASCVWCAGEPTFWGDEWWRWWGEWSRFMKRTQGDFLVRGGFRLCSSSFLLRGKYCNIISRWCDMIWLIDEATQQDDLNTRRSNSSVVDFSYAYLCVYIYIFLIYGTYIISPHSQGLDKNIVHHWAFLKMKNRFCW